VTAAARQRSNHGRGPQRFLTIDIGGSGLKAAVVDRDGQMLTERMRVKTPTDLTPQTLVAQLATLVEPLGGFDRVSVGFRVSYVTARSSRPRIWVLTNSRDTTSRVPCGLPSSVGSAWPTTR
jgi:predicted NBD/HSP70 family sugar kinase